MSSKSNVRWKIWKKKEEIIIMATKCKSGFKKVRRGCAKFGSTRARTGMGRIDISAIWLLIIGGLAWISLGLFKFDFVIFLLRIPIFASLVYVLVGISSIYLIIRMFMKFK